MDISYGVGIVATWSLSSADIVCIVGPAGNIDSM